MNGFDAAVCVLALVAVITGFNTGLLRSLATIIGYLCAMPLAIAATPPITSLLVEKFNVPWAQNPLLVFAVFLIAGIALAALLRSAVSEIVGPSISVADRFTGALLGAIRVALVAVTLVLIFDRIIPPDRQPDFLKGSQLKPVLSVAGQIGLKSLPPEVTAFIDRLKRDRGF